MRLDGTLFIISLMTGFIKIGFHSCVLETGVREYFHIHVCATLTLVLLLKEANVKRVIAGINLVFLLKEVKVKRVINLSGHKTCPLRK